MRATRVAIVALLAPVAASSQPIGSWRLGPEPVIVGPETDFLAVDGTIRLGNGSFAVSDRRAHQLLFFDATGRPGPVLGRKGSGPGEFESIWRTSRRGDTVLIYDSSLRRISEFVGLPTPRLIRTTRFVATSDRGGFFIDGQLANGRWLVSTGSSPHWDMRQGQRDSSWFGTVAPDGTGRVTWIGGAPGLAMFIHKPDTSMRGAVVGPIPFSPNALALAVGRTVWIGDNSIPELIAHREGRTPHPVRLPIALQPISRTTLYQARRNEAANERSDPLFLATKYSSAVAPKTFPAFQRLIAGPASQVWIEVDARLPGSATRYLVLGEGGSPLAWVVTRAGFRIHEVGVDYVLGIQTDDDDVEQVHLYSLYRTGDRP